MYKDKKVDHLELQFPYCKMERSSCYGLHVLTGLFHLSKTGMQNNQDGKLES